MDVNVEIDELVVDGDDAALRDQLAARLDPVTAAAVARAVADALGRPADPAVAAAGQNVS